VRHRGGFIGAVVFMAFVFAGVFAPVITSYDPIIANVSIATQGSSAAHWLGTDELGRDVLSRMLYGAGVSLRVGLLSVAAGAIIGTAVGSLTGYLGGGIDLVGQRVVDTIQAFPGLLLAILLSAAAGPSPEITVAVLGALSVPAYSRLVRGSVLVAKRLEYVEAARAVGCPTHRVLIRHVLPNAISVVIVQSSLQFATSVLLLAGLGYLGLGAQPPTPEWGAMLAEGRIYIRSAPHMVVFPCVAISIVVISLNLIGDALRDALDPRML
jgi:peptide/nickel transport system permease protein